jgi:predicted Rossmann fold nucleotide-binding protein DprA/Smf involved in DNA uptake
MSAGCNNLIKIGAAPITSVEDILHELGLQDGKQAKLPLAQTKEEDVLLKLLVDGVSEGDELQQKSGLPAATFSQTMSMMEIEGKIRALGANHWAIRR